MRADVCVQDVNPTLVEVGKSASLLNEASFLGLLKAYDPRFVFAVASSPLFHALPRRIAMDVEWERGRAVVRGGGG